MTARKSVRTSKADEEPQMSGGKLVLSKADRDFLFNIIDEKGESTVSTATAQLVIDDDVIRARLLQQAGHPYTEEQLQIKRREFEQKLKALKIGNDEQLEELVVDKGRLDARIEAEIENLKLAAKAKIDEIEAAVRQQANEKRASKKERVRDLDKQIETRRNELVDAAAPGLRREMDMLNREIPAVTEYTHQIVADVERMARNARKTKERLGYLIADATSRAKLRVLQCASIDEAQKVIDDCIPSVAEVIHGAEDEEGMKHLLNKIAPGFNTSLAIEAPKYEAPMPNIPADPISDQIVSSFLDGSSSSLVETEQLVENTL